MRRLGEQRGIALVMTLGILVVIGIVTVSLLSYSSSNLRSVRYGDARQKASAAAEAGLNDAISVLSQVASSGGDVRDPSSLPVGSDTFDGASASWAGSVSGDTWTITATATVPNPTGAGDIQRTVSSGFRIGVDGQGSAPAWQYTFAEAPTCMTLQNSSQISVPFYIVGDLCLKNSANPTADEITVKGHISLENSSQIGSPSDPISYLHTSGCGGKNGPYSLANCTPAYHVYADHVDSVFKNVAKPAVDLPYWYAYSKPGPKNGCTTGSFPGGFDNDTTMNHSRSAVTLLPSTAYSCTVTVGSSVVGKLVWTPGVPGSPGTLQVSGVIFFDGDIVFQNSEQAIYSGRATIYTSGTVTFQNSAFLCGAANCDPLAWDGDSNMITFVAGSSTQQDSFVTKNNTEFQGGVWSNNDTRQQNDSLIEGPTISRQLYLQNSAVAQVWPSIDFVSYGAPAPIGATKLVPITGTFSD
jgi:hypothetical protein